MNPTALVIALILIGWGGGKLLLRRIPQGSKKQIFCAVAALVAAVLTVASEMRAPIPGFWYYTSLVIAVVMTRPCVPPSVSLLATCALRL